MSDSVVVTGIVKVIEDTQTFASGFQKRVIVVETPDAKYPQFIPIEFLKDNITKLDPLCAGQQVEIKANLRGNEHKGKYYLNLVGWFVEAGGSNGAPASNEPEGFDEDDSIPF